MMEHEFGFTPGVEKTLSKAVEVCYERMKHTTVSSLDVTRLDILDGLLGTMSMSRVVAIRTLIELTLQPEEIQELVNQLDKN